VSKVIELSDDQYQAIERAAALQGQSPDALLAQWIEELRDRERGPRYYETDDWFRHLGATEEQIAEAKRIAESRSRASDAHP
jgi:hypothetical protein